MISTFKKPFGKRQRRVEFEGGRYRVSCNLNEASQVYATGRHYTVEQFVGGKWMALDRVKRVEIKWDVDGPATILIEQHDSCR